MICGLLTLSATNARAGRPLDTEDTGTVAEGHVELELGHAYTRDGPDDGSTGVAVVTVGLTDDAEARIEGGFQVVAPANGRAEAGVADTVLGAKWRFADETLSTPAWLAAATIRLPTGDADRGLGTRKVDVAALLVASKVFGDFNVEANVGYVVATRDRALDYWMANVGCEYAATRSLILVAESVSTLSGPAASDALLFRTGLVYGLTPSVKLDAAIAAGATRSAPDVIVTTGVTLAIY